MSDDQTNIKAWFDKNVHGGLEKYLVGISRDIEEIEKAETRAKIKLDLVKTVEQVLATLEHLNTSSEKEIVFNFQPLTQKEIDDHWGE